MSLLKYLLPLSAIEDFLVIALGATWLILTWVIRLLKKLRAEVAQLKRQSKLA